MLAANNVSWVVRAEIRRISDLALLPRIRELLVPPYSVERDWEWDSGTEIHVLDGARTFALPTPLSHTAPRLRPIRALGTCFFDRASGNRNGQCMVSDIGISLASQPGVACSTDNHERARTDGNDGWRMPRPTRDSQITMRLGHTRGQS